MTWGFFFGVFLVAVFAKFSVVLTGAYIVWSEAIFNGSIVIDIDHKCSREIRRFGLTANKKSGKHLKALRRR